jgi:CubicO group peptidase (beta-lactamase class C family)
MEMRELIETECARFGVPGAAVTAVSDGDVVLADGFGLRNDTDPVTAQTLFMLASDTKCFAAATLCLLAEDGLLDLDEPVRTYLPWFAMHDDRISEWVTSRDLLAHRTGLPRHDFMTIGDGDWRISNEDLARRMRYLESCRPFRQGFGYNNAHYATAGHVAEVITGQPWREILADRILKPLEMTGTSTYFPSLTTGDFAAPHNNGTRLAFQTRPYDLPSGGIVTNAQDLGPWLLARLGKGTLSADVLAKLHAPCMVSGPALPFPEFHSMGYALGNMAFSYRGHRLHVHGGNQVGYASQVLVLPDARIGIAVLTNTHASGLPLALGLALVDHLLGVEEIPWGTRLFATPQAPPAMPSGEPSSRPLAEHAGTFHHPAYGDFGVAVQGDELKPSFHGLDEQLLFTHRDGDDWLLSFASVPGISVPVTFGAGPEGRDVALRLDAELAPLVFARQ